MPDVVQQSAVAALVERGFNFGVIGRIQGCTEEEVRGSYGAYLRDRIPNSTRINLDGYPIPHPGSPAFWYPMWTFYATGYPEEARRELRTVISNLLAMLGDDTERLALREAVEGGGRSINPVVVAAKGKGSHGAEIPVIPGCLDDTDR